MAIVATSALGACGFMTPAKQYAGDIRPESGVAVVKGYLGVPFSDDYHATVMGYTKKESGESGEQKKFGLPGFTDYPGEIHVLPGDYSVQVYCFRGFSSFRPSTAMSLQAGKTYLLQCNVREGQAAINVHTSTTL